MGYNTRVTGELAITPPLTWLEFKSSPFYSTIRVDRDVSLRELSEEVDTEEGTFHHRTAVALVPTNPGERFSNYHLLDHVQEAIDAFPGHAFTGRLECEGDEAGDLWRVYVRDGKAVRVEPRIVWPDEEAGA